MSVTIVSFRMRHAATSRRNTHESNARLLFMIVLLFSRQIFRSSLHIGVSSTAFSTSRQLRYDNLTRCARRYPCEFPRILPFHELIRPPYVLDISGRRKIVEEAYIYISQVTISRHRSRRSLNFSPSFLDGDIDTTLLRFTIRSLKLVKKGTVIVRRSLRARQALAPGLD